MADTNDSNSFPKGCGFDSHLRHLQVKLVPHTNRMDCTTRFLFRLIVANHLLHHVHNVYDSRQPILPEYVNVQF